MHGNFWKKYSIIMPATIIIIIASNFICIQAIKRKLDDIGKKLAILYDLLRESKVCTSSYTKIAQCINIHHFYPSAGLS